MNFLLENNTNKEAAYTSTKIKLLWFKKNTQGVKKIQPNWKMTDHQWGNIAKAQSRKTQKME